MKELSDDKYKEFEEAKTILKNCILKITIPICEPILKALLRVHNFIEKKTRSKALAFIITLLISGSIYFGFIVFVILTFGGRS